MIFIFGLFGVVGNYTAIVVDSDARIISSMLNPVLEMNNAIADTRNIGIIIGGFLGGPLVGLGAAIIAGGHRLWLGGFIGIASFLASIIGGLLAGWFHKKLRGIGLIRPMLMFAFGILILTVQILLIPVFASNHKVALYLISYTGVPIIVVNSLGILICAMIFYSVHQSVERTRASQTERTLFIAEETLSLFREGLSESTAKKAAPIIQGLTRVADISITRGIRQLAHTGSHVFTKQSIKNEREIREEVLASNKMQLKQSYKNFFSYKAEKSSTFIVLPLKGKDKVIGTITFYYTNPFLVTPAEIELAEGLSKLFSNQLKLGETERYNQLLQDAEMKALHAQIHPHFLFNALNTIVSLCRTNPLLARDLLLHLSTFLRSNLTGLHHQVIPLEKELKNVYAYLAIEQARFPNKFVLHTKIDPMLKTAHIPPFIIQSLVENAVIHGQIKNRPYQGRIEISVQPISSTTIKLIVTDNGIGIDATTLKNLGKQIVPSSQNGNGSALFNIRERLIALYSRSTSFSINSVLGSSTSVEITIPLSFGRLE